MPRATVRLVDMQRSVGTRARGYRASPTPALWSRGTHISAERVHFLEHIAVLAAVHLARSHWPGWHLFFSISFYFLLVVDGLERSMIFFLCLEVAIISP